MCFMCILFRLGEHALVIVKGVSSDATNIISVLKGVSWWCASITSEKRNDIRKKKKRHC